MNSPHGCGDETLGSVYVEEMVFGRRYRVIEKIGSGGMADVFKAVDEVLGRTVAVKVLHPRYASDPGFVARFRQEAQAAANLSHPGIVNIYDWGRDDETYYIVMEFVHGTDLKHIIEERGPIDPMKAAEYGAQACAALAVAHGYDIIHRDIKPHNIILAPDGTVKVMDFGIARAGNTTMTQTGSVLGTAHYVSPEQAQGRPLGPASDLYSLGIVLYELTTGRLPFDADAPVAVALKQVNEQPVPPREIEPSIPAGLEAVIMRAMQKDPSARYASAEEMRADLKRVLAGATVEQPAAMAAGAMVPPADQTSVMPAIGVGGSAQGVHPPQVRPVPQRRSPWPWIVMILLALLAALGIAYAMGAFDVPEPEVPVPNLTGMTVPQAAEALEPLGLTVGPIEERPSDTVPLGEIMDQFPGAGDEVPAGSEVSLVVSSGEEPEELVTVPGVVGMSESEAIRTLRDAGFQYDISREHRQDVPVDEVFSQDPASGDTVIPGSLVTIVVSRGADSRAVPSVIGRTHEEARQILTQAGFTVTTAEEHSETAERGRIIDQSPAANSVILAGAEVRITISLGPEMIPVPNVIGMTEGEATSVLQTAGLRVAVQYEESLDDDAVLTQDPIPGASVLRNATVRIWVGRAPDEEPAD